MLTVKQKIGKEVDNMIDPIFMKRNVFIYVYVCICMYMQYV